MPGKSALFFFLCASLALTVSATAASITPATPAKAADGCYQISTAEELYGFAAIVNGRGVTKDVSACGKLTKDITINAGVLNSDGTLNSGASADFATWTPMASFSGTFDGQGHKISGLYFNNSSTSNVGFVNVLTGGSVEKPVTIKNLEIADSYIRGSSNVAGFAVYAQSGVVQISNSVFSSVIDAKYVSGGFVSRAAAGSTLYIDNCLFNGKISAQTNTGGFVGQTLQGMLFLNNSVSVGSVVYTGTGSALQYGVKVLFGNKYSGSATIENSFYLESEGIGELGGFAATAEQLADGSVTKALRIFKDQSRDVDGFVWGQKVGTDAYPVLSGTLEGYTGVTSKVIFHTYEGDEAVYATEYVPGYPVTLPVSSREHYQFMGWYTSSDFSGTPATQIPANVSGTREFWAKYLRIYDITLDVADGKVDSADVSAYTVGIGTALPKKVSRSGYVFKGWILDGDESNTYVDSVTTAMSGDLKFVAQWYQVKAPAKGSDGCYEISSAAELYGFAGMQNGIYGMTMTSATCAKLTKDIEVNAGVLKDNGDLDSAKVSEFIAWTSIENFGGTFDGQGHTVSGLFQNDTTLMNGGLFGKLKAGSESKPVTIKNVGLVNSFIRARSYSAAIAADTDESTYLVIQNCYNNSTIYGYYYGSGIIGNIGYLSKAFIVNCYNVGSVYGSSSVAGLLIHTGSQVSVTFVNCFNLGKIVSNGIASNAKMLSAVKPTTLVMENCFYLKENGNKEYGGKPATKELFENGSVAEMLKETSYAGYDGKIWGQNVGVDAYPVFSGSISNSKVAKHAVTLHTFDGDKASYYDSFVEGFSKALPVPSRESYSFRGWFNNAEFTGSKVDSILATANTDQEFWAKYEREFTVSLNVNGGSISSGNVTSYVEGIGAVLPQNVIQNGKIFMGWYTDANFSGTQVKTISTTDEGNKVFYAKWMTVKVPQVENDCYVISDVDELYTYAAIVNGTSGYAKYTYVCAILSADIQVNKNVLKEDGSLDSAREEEFISWAPLMDITGSIDGRGHSISGLYLNDTAKEYVGFVGKANLAYNSTDLTIKNLKIKDSFIRGKNYVAGVIAHAYNNMRTLKLDSVSFDGVISAKYNFGGFVGNSNGPLVIQNSSVSGKVSLWDNTVGISNNGGFVGNTSNSVTIANSENHAVVDGKSRVAGFVGNSYGTIDITDCFNDGKITGGFDDVAGILGYTSGTINITNTRNSGEIVSSQNYVGGLIGANGGTLNLLQSYNEGPVSGQDYVGGLVGQNTMTFTIANSYNIGTVKGRNYVAGILGYTSKTTSYFNGSSLLNSYSMAEVSGTKYVDPITYIYSGTTEHFSNIDNNFYLDYEGVVASVHGTAKEKSAFADTSVTKELHAYVQKDAEGVAVEGGITGLVWGQDSIPLLVTKSVYAIGFVLNGGTLENAPSAYDVGTELTLPTPTREGYKFMGWYAKSTFGSADDVVTKIRETDFGNKMFYAQWEVLQYKVTVSVNDEKMGYVTGLKNDGVYNYDESIWLTPVPANGYYFTDWTSDVGEFKTEQISFHVKGDMNLVANFAKIVESSSSADPESSSSSENIESSSSEEPSSSSVASSSSKKDSSSSSEDKDAIDVVGPVPQFALAVFDRSIQVAGASVGSAYAVLDMQGRVIASGRVSASNFNITLGRVGTYLVRIGTQAKTVRLR